MKHKVRSVVMFLLAGFAFYYGYTQRHEARVQREKVQDLYRQIKTLQEEANAARAEAARLRMALEKEKEAVQKIRLELEKRALKH
jgi:hypothetical protein